MNAPDEFDSVGTCDISVVGNVDSLDDGNTTGTVFN